MPQLEIVWDEKRWHKIPQLQKKLEEALRIAFTQLPKNLRFPFSATLLLTNDRSIKILNRDFRGKDEATNVLSFPQFDLKQLPKIGKGEAHGSLGDVALAYQYIVGEARSTHKILRNHTIHLFVHGLLHLLGYDHAREKDAKSMERLEKKIMAELKLPDPYKVGPSGSKKRSAPTRRTTIKVKQSHP